MSALAIVERERLAALVDEGQAAGEIATRQTARKASSPESGVDRVPVPHQRIAEGRSLARTNAVEHARHEAKEDAA